MISINLHVRLVFDAITNIFIEHEQAFFYRTSSGLNSSLICLLLTRFFNITVCRYKSLLFFLCFNYSELR